jgi:SAM-dependent methyltransferase
MRDHLFGTPDQWNLRRCRRCDVVWVDPRPREEAFGAIYPGTYLTHEAGAAGSGRLVPAWAAELILAGWFGYADQADGDLRRRFGWWAGFLFPWLREFVAGEVAGLSARERGRLLDVGCGNGRFLQTMARLGWTVFGVEPDAAAAAVARASLGEVIHSGRIGDAPFPEGSFDVIVMKHVIEHLPDPTATLRACHRFLRAGGKIVVITPNARSLGGRLFGRDWLGWDVPRHFTIFSRTAMRSVLERAGFRRIDVATPTRKAARMWQMSRALKRGRMSNSVVGLDGGRPTMAALVFWVAECACNVVRPCGEELRAVAEKP